MFVASVPKCHIGQVIGNGHCVAYVREAAKLPHTSKWRRGVKVRGNEGLKLGTAIATFDPNDCYGNHTDGRSHCAVLLDIQDKGLLVCDQWKGQPVHERFIRFKDGVGTAVNDGDQYYVIEA
jgi:hypothetical protein